MPYQNKGNVFGKKKNSPSTMDCWLHNTFNFMQKKKTNTKKKQIQKKQKNTQNTSKSHLLKVDWVISLLSQKWAQIVIDAEML